jgi:hypothetical protein
MFWLALSSSLQIVRCLVGIVQGGTRSKFPCKAAHVHQEKGAHWHFKMLINAEARRIWLALCSMNFGKSFSLNFFLYG